MPPFSDFGRTVKACDKVLAYLDARKGKGWREKGESWSRGWNMMKDLLVN